MSRVAGRGALWVGLMAGCTVEPITSEGFRCEADGGCRQGYSCDPLIDECVTDGSPCEGALRRSRCVSFENDCSLSGCRLCEDGAWTECRVFTDDCVPDTITCVGFELWPCDGAGKLGLREACGFLGCNDSVDPPRCNTCVPNTESCEGSVWVRCSARGERTEEDCAMGAPSRCANARACTINGCTDVGSAPFGTPCDEGAEQDGNFCNSRCDGVGNCRPGPPQCDDGRECTDPDSCNPSFGCAVQALPSGEACGDRCNETCDGTGNCIAAAVDCEDGDPCTSHTCQPGSGCQSTPVADGGPCDDLDACTDTDQCAGGVCTGSGNPCDDGDPCTADVCGATCQNPPVLCPPTLGECAENTACDSMLSAANCAIVDNSKDGMPCGDCANPPCSTCLAARCVDEPRCDGGPAAVPCTLDGDCMVPQCNPGECRAAACVGGRCTADAFAAVGSPCASCPGVMGVGCECQSGSCVDSGALINVSNLPMFDPCTDSTTDIVFPDGFVDTGAAGDPMSTPTINGVAYPMNSMISTQSPGNPEAAVFYFNNISIPADVDIRGQRALILVACNDIVVGAAGRIDIGGADGQNGTGGSQRGGGYRGGFGGTCNEGCDGGDGRGPGAGGGGGYDASGSSRAGGGGGGGFGGLGGRGGFGSWIGGGSRGASGPRVTNLRLAPLNGGSGGGAGGDGEGGGDRNARGGAGGGAVQLSANGRIVIDGHLNVRGGKGSDSESSHGAGGGGSGGGILLEAPQVILGSGSELRATGGNGGVNHDNAAAGADGTQDEGAGGDTELGEGGNGGGGGCGRTYINVDTSAWPTAVGQIRPLHPNCYLNEGSLTYQ